MNHYILMAGCLTLSVLFSCSPEEEKTARENFPVIQPLMADTSYTTDYVAELSAIQNVEIRSRIGGYLEEILVDEGQRVVQDQVLFRISKTEYQQELNRTKANTRQAAAELKAAEIERSNSKSLFEKGIIAKTEFDLTEARVESLQARYDAALQEEEQAALNLSFTDVRAPFSGVLNRLEFREGSLIDAGSLLTTLTNDDEMFVYFNLSENDYLNVSNNLIGAADVRLMLANGAAYPYAGVVETSESSFDNSTGSLAYRAKFPNPDKMLKHGATGKIRVISELNDAMLIPQKCTFEIQSNLYVYVVDSTNHISQRLIIPSHRIPHLYAIQSGLDPEDRIVYEGIQRVKEGDLINPEPSVKQSEEFAKN
jgi:RND family efflux transporter MFP subunit